MGVNEQKSMERSAFQRMADACATFNDIMTGPNPLSPMEIRKLVRERPRLWGMFEAWAHKEG